VLQRRIESPLVDVDALTANRALSGALVVQLLLYFNAYSSIFIFSLFMQVSLGIPSDDAGTAIAVGSVVMAIGAPVSGRLGDAFRPRIVSTIGVVCVLACALASTTLNGHSSRAMIATLLAIQGLGFAFFSSPNMTIIMNSVGAGDTGMASALSAKARSLGMVGGMLITTLLITLHIGNDPVKDHPLEFIATTHTAFVILSVTAGMALSASVLMRGPRPRPQAVEST